MTEIGDVVRDVRELERSVSAIKSDVISATSEAKDARHLAGQVGQTNLGLNSRLDKMELRLNEHIERLSAKIDDKVDRLEEKLITKIEGNDARLATIKLQQAKGAGFWAGVVFVFTIGSGVAGGIFAVVSWVLKGHG